MKEELRKIERQRKALLSKVSKKLTKKIDALPDNPKIKRVSKNCYTINSKDLEMRFDPFYHDFKRQYTVIVKLIDKTENITTIQTILDEITDKGYTDRLCYGLRNGRKHFNPVVVGYIREIYK